ncbi:hypothetical protein [Nocardia thailandica]
MFPLPFRRRATEPSELGAPLPQSAVPTMSELETEVDARVTRLTAAGAADEYCAHVLDAYLDAWHAETVVSLTGTAREQRRRDREYLDALDARAARLRARADAAARRAEDRADHADRLWKACAAETG